MYIITYTYIYMGIDKHMLTKANPMAIWPLEASRNFDRKLVFGLTNGVLLHFKYRLKSGPLYRYDRGPCPQICMTGSVACTTIS